jgi:hypothetical protein
MYSLLLVRICENAVVRNERTTYLVFEDRCEASIETTEGSFVGEYPISSTEEHQTRSAFSANAKCSITSLFSAYALEGVLANAISPPRRKLMASATRVKEHHRIRPDVKRRVSKGTRHCVSNLGSLVKRRVSKGT